MDLLVLTSAKDKAELFAQLFAINSNIDDSNATLPDFPKRTESNLSNINFTVSDVSKIIAGLDSSKASGPDGIPTIVLQMCGPELAPVLTKLFKKCIKESCFPSCWKLPSVVPVFKNNGERSNAGDYRPISLLPVVSKVFEILINSSIIKHLDSNDIRSDHQYCF